MSRRNVICQVSYKAHDTPDVAHGSLCSVETGSLPVLTVPELLHGENSTLICEVRNAIPAPIIEIHVGNVLHGDVQQTDTFNESSHTFTSSAKVTKANTLWNGKEMCCTMKSRYDFGQKQVSVCKNISMKYPPSDLSMSVNKNIENNKKKSGCYLNMSCQTSKSNPPCAIEWSSDNDYLRYVHSSNWANADSGNYRSVSNVLYNVTNDMAGGTITCSTRCNHFTSNVNKNYELSCSDIPLCLFMETSIVKESNPEFLNLTFNTGPTCMPCAISWTTNFVFLHPISISQWTKNSGLGIISVSNALFLLTKDVDGKRIQCSAKCGNDSSDIIHETYTIVFEAFQEAATNPASVVALQFHVSVLYALSGTILLLFITKLALLLFRRCKSQAYEMFLRRRKTAYSDPSSHVYDAVQSTAEATMLHDIRRISASASENISPLSATEEHQAPSNRNVCHYDYVDIPSDQQTHETITQAESYIHAI
ncbi:uncharacterized protein LOC128234974 isoform X1 [Mya arenaria]|uniref:uncharacterized protein LOC128234974 isoform X1 n=1 Tax=Mya arenaria TaxID=6604 RepID=UPI0022E9420C|nr:uncharacterized protein LOC128234974 isoform X1 [Mya arenaria]